MEPVTAMRIFAMAFLSMNRMLEFFQAGGLLFPLWFERFEDDHSQQRLRDADLLKFESGHLRLLSQPGS